MVTYFAGRYIVEEFLGTFYLCHFCSFSYGFGPEELSETTEKHICPYLLFSGLGRERMESSSSCRPFVSNTEEPPVPPGVHGDMRKGINKGRNKPPLTFVKIIF